MDEKGVETLFFELASENRTGILKALQTRSLKMQEIARELDLTDTEAFRQLQRLSEAGLVQRQPDGTYAITQYARLAIQLSASIDFVYKHKEYFSNHDVWRLPIQFINRIGELSESTLIMESLESISRVEKIIQGAEEYLCGIGEGQMTETMGATVKAQSEKGVKTKVLSLRSSAKHPNYENRMLSSTSVFMILSEKEVIVCFRFNDGRMDYAGFAGNDIKSLGWARDLFLFYWDKDSSDFISSD